ncbi:metal-dependent hydrolase [Candidatus Dependentiae bacterium]|nr:metal-dependent hydrolase [Candidatus Dependentiae bacterium]
MPSYKGHLVGGVIVYLIALCSMQYIVFFDIALLIQGLLFCLLGALFPDIDTKSKGQKLFYIFWLIVLFYCFLRHYQNLFVFVSFLGALPLLSRHRGLFHSVGFLLFILLIIICSFFNFSKKIDYLLLINSGFFTIGFLSHIFLDKFFSKMKRYF